MIIINELFLKSQLVFIQKPSFRPIVPLAAICYSEPILMKFHMHITYIEKLR